MVAVIGYLAYSIMAVGGLLAIWTGVSAIRHRPTGEIQMVLTIVLEAALVAQTIIALVRLSGADLAEPVAFTAYSVGVLVPLPLGFQLARIERTRWGSISLCFVALVVVVMTLRLAHLWGLIGG